MSSALLEALEQLGEAIHTEDRPAFAYVPEGVTTPSYVIQPGEPYLDGDEVTFGMGTFNLHAEVFCLVALDDNETASSDLDGALAHLLTTMPDLWGVDEVAQPGPVSTTEWIAHGVRVRLSRYISL